MKKEFKIILSILAIIIFMVLIFFVIDYFLRKNSVGSSDKIPTHQQNDSEVIIITVTPTQENWPKEELKKNPTAYQEALKNRTIDKVTITVKDETITPTGATFILTDKNDASCGYVDEYKIERNILGIWMPVIPITFTMTVAESYTLAKETVEHKKDWAEIYGALRKGKYRFAQKVHINDQYQYIYAEFTI